MLFCYFLGAARFRCDRCLRLGAIWRRAMHRTVMLALMAGSLLAGLAAPVRADGTEPVIVIPCRPGVPVMLYGRDVSGAVLEGDWGLARPGVVTPTIVQEGWAAYPVFGPAPPYYP